MSEHSNQPTAAIPQTSASRQGAWVTIHITIGNTDKSILGFLTGTEAGQYKLTKYVNQYEEEGYGESAQYQRGIQTKIHTGVWLVNPLHVWMVEHEQEAPVEGFKPYPHYGATFRG